MQSTQRTCVDANTKWNQVYETLTFGYPWYNPTQIQAEAYFYQTDMKKKTGP